MTPSRTTITEPQSARDMTLTYDASAVPAPIARDSLPAEGEPVPEEAPCAR